MLVEITSQGSVLKDGHKEERIASSKRWWDQPSGYFLAARPTEGSADTLFLHFWYFQCSSSVFSSAALGRVWLLQKKTGRVSTRCERARGEHGVDLMVSLHGSGTRPNDVLRLFCLVHLFMYGPVSVGKRGWSKFHGWARIQNGEGLDR